MHLENLGKQHWKALGRIMGHLKNHQQPLYLHATKELRLMAHSDSDWVADHNDRKSMTSYFTTVSGTYLVNSNQRNRTQWLFVKH